MSLLYICEYEAVYHSPAGIPMALEPGTDQTPVSISGSSNQSVQFNPSTKYVRLSTDVNCSILFGTNPTAVTNTNKRMAAGQTEYFAVTPSATKVAVVSSS